jgi:hypothetical protein
MNTLPWEIDKNMYMQGEIEKATRSCFYFQPRNFTKALSHSGSDSFSPYALDTPPVSDLPAKAIRQIFFWSFPSEHPELPTHLHSPRVL